MNASLQNRRTWVVGGAAVAAVISAASWFFVISPVHSDTDSVQARTVSVQQQNVIAQHKLRDLANSQSQLPQLQAQLVRALEGAKGVALPHPRDDVAGEFEVAGDFFAEGGDGGLADLDAFDAIEQAGARGGVEDVVGEGDAGAFKGVLPAVADAHEDAAEIEDDESLHKVPLETSHYPRRLAAGASSYSGVPLAMS